MKSKLFRRKIRAGAAFAVALAGLAFNATAANWYVATEGSDANSGVSWEQALATPAAAVALASVGDTVLVSNGNYVVSTPIVWDLGGLTIRGAGANADDTVLQASGTRILTMQGVGNVISNLQFIGATSEAVLIQNGNNSVIGDCVFASNDYGLVLSNSSHCAISGAVFTNNTSAGVWLRYSQYNIWQDCRFLRNKSGFHNGEPNDGRKGDSRGQQFTRCIFAHQSAYAALLSADRSGTGVVFNHCTFFNNKNIVNYGQYAGGVITNSIVAGVARVLHQTTETANPYAYVGASLLHAIARINGNDRAKALESAVVSPTGPSFVDPGHDDFRLYADSPALGQTEDGKAYGAYPEAADAVALPAVGIWYVDATGGSDANDGATSETAFATLQKAASVVTPGDLVEVAAGTYAGPVVVSAAGSLTRPIRFRGVPGAVISGGDYGTHLRQASNVILEGFEIQSATTYGVYAEGSADWTLTNCVVRGATAGGISAFRTVGGFVSGCIITNNNSYGILLRGSGTTVYRSFVCHNKNTGIFGQTPDSVFSSGGHFILESAIAFNSGSGITLPGTRVNNYGWNVRSSVIFGNTANGFADIMHNNAGTITNCIVANNGTTGIKGYTASTMVADYNNVSGNAIAYDSYVTFGPNNIAVDPVFVDAPVLNFHLYEDSPCIAAGEGGVDIGMYPNGPTVTYETSANYFVAPGGDDSAAGTSWEAAFATIGKAASVVGYGGTVEIASGVYTGQVALATPGLATLPIRFHGNGMVAIVWTNGPAITADGANYTILENFTVASTAGSGVHLANSTGMTISNFVVEASQNGIHLYGSGNATLHDVVVRNCGAYGIQLELSNGFTLNDGVVADNASDGIHIGGNYRNNPCVGGTLRRCWIARNGSDGVLFEGDSSSGWTVEQTTVVANRGKGIGGSGSGGNWSPVTVTNSVVAYNTGIGLYMVNTLSPYTHSLFYGNGWDIQKNDSLPTNSVPGADRGGNVFEDPNLVSYMTDDGALYVDSPALGSGAGGVNMGVYPGAGVTYSAPRSFFVRNDGSDANNGLTDTPEGAWASLEPVVATPLRPGDTIHIASGVYTGAVVFAGVTGTASRPIRISGTPDAILLASAGQGMTFAQATRIVIDGLSFLGEDGQSDTLLSFVDARSCLLRQSTLNGGGWNDAGGNLRVLHSPVFTAERCDISGSHAWNAVYLEGSPRILLVNSEIHDNSRRGVWVRSEKVMSAIRQCNIYNNTEGVRLDNFSSIDIQSSLFHGNSINGLFLFANGIASEISNTIFYDNTYGIYRETHNPPYIIKNCLFWANTTADCQNIELDAASLVADPLFRDPDDGGFRLLSESPAIDAGYNQDWMVEATDMAGSPRVDNFIVDIGPYELFTHPTLYLLR